MFTKEQLYRGIYIVDIEATGLLEDNPSIHVLSCRYFGNTGWETISTTDLDKMRSIFEDEDNIVVGHFFKSYDINVLKLNIPDMEVNCSIIDTLPLSQYLFEGMMSHGLEAFGKVYGTLKTEVSKDQWQGLTNDQLDYLKELEGKKRGANEETAYQDLKMQYEDHQALMKERCEGDVLINQKLWIDILDYLFELYDGSEEDVNRIITKTIFKMDQLQGQYDNPIKLDLEFTQKSHDTLTEIYEGKKEALEAEMPEVPKYVKKTKPKVMNKKDGTLSAAAVKWYELLKSLDLSEDEEGPIEYIGSYEPPNAGSPGQLKDHLESLGWVPKEFKDGANGPVPQVMVDEDGVKVLCSSIVKMIEEHPHLENLKGMSVAKHRLGIVKGFLKNDIGGGHVRAQWSGITASWRVKHTSPICNLPSNRAQYGEYIRKCLVAPEGYVWMNADLSSLEDKTKQNCIIDLDPEYVKTLNIKGFDAHLNLGLLAGFFTDEEVEFFKWYKKLDKDKGETESLPGIEKFPSFKHFTGKQAYEFNEVLAVRRQGAKVSNYSCLYYNNLIDTPLGPKPMNEIQIGDLVYGGREDKRPVKVIDKVPEHEDFLYRLSIKANYDNKEPNRKVKGVESTLTHRWLLENGEYKILEELEYGDVLNLGEGRTGVYQGKKHMQNKKEVVSCLVTETGNFYMYSRFGANEDSILTGNCTYGVGAVKLSASADITLKEAKKLINTYWDLNWSVKEFAEALPVKEVRGQKFIWSPFSRLWLVLRSDHMKFSIVNQNFGATVFDVWMYFMEEQGYEGILAYHDEGSWYVKDTPEEKEKARQAVQIAIEKTNEVFNLPVKFEAEPEFAYSYGDVH